MVGGGPGSVVGSMMYCGRFPAMEPGACLYCGELRCPHTDTDEVSLVSSAGQSSATSAAASDQLVCWPGGRSCSEELQSPEQAQPQARDYRGGGTLSRQALHQVGSHNNSHVFTSFHSYSIPIKILNANFVP